MKPRRRKGATLGLVAVSVLVIIVIGIACFFLAKICGSGREVANLTDAGTLNIAQNMLRSQVVTTNQDGTTIAGGYDDFAACVDTVTVNGATVKGINLYTYNRCVAQALLVAMNAAAESNANSAYNAKQVFNKLNYIGTQLTAMLSKQSTMTSMFTAVASQNSAKMTGYNSFTPNTSQFAPGWMKVAASTNVFFSPSELVSLTPPTGMNTSVSNAVKTTMQTISTNNGLPYMAGYTPFAISLPAGGVSFTIEGVPVMPQTACHLASLKDFDNQTGAPLAALTAADPNKTSTPPNAWKAGSISTDGKSNALGGAIACALVGVVNQTNGTPNDFAGSFPHGYLWIRNESGANTAPFSSWTGPANNADNIFNWELDGQSPHPGYLSFDTTGGDNAFFRSNDTTPSQLADWGKYNAAGQPAAPATWVNSAGQTTQGPPSMNGIYLAQDTNGNFTSLSSSNMAQFKPFTGTANSPCSQEATGNGIDANCSNYLKTFATAYGRTLPVGAPLGSMPPLSMIDMEKLELINKFNTTHPYSVEIDGGKSGGTQFGNNESLENGYNSLASVNYDNVTGYGALKDTHSQDAQEYAWTGVSGSSANPLDGNLPPVEQYGTGNRDTTYDLLNIYSNPDPAASQLSNFQGGCSGGASGFVQGIIGMLQQRMNEINPGDPNAKTPGLVQGFLKTQELPVGGNLYIYKDPTTQVLVIKKTPPSWVPVNGNGVPVDYTTMGSSMTQVCDYSKGHPVLDGNITQPSNYCAADYANGDLVDDYTNGLVDTHSANAVNGADDNLHEAPYITPEPGVPTGTPLSATDHVEFRPSSGYQNILGQLYFYQTSTGSETFQRPN